MTGESDWQGFHTAPPGTPTNDPRSFAGASCYWKSSNPADLVTLTTTSAKGSQTPPDSCNTVRSDRDAKPAPGVGDQAWIISASNDVHVCLTKSNRALLVVYRVSSPSPQDQATALATDAAARLPE